jgi:hypothetical protein
MQNEIKQIDALIESLTTTVDDSNGTRPHLRSALGALTLAREQLEADAAYEAAAAKQTTSQAK